MSVKKEASGRQSVRVEVEVPGGTQSAAARRSAEAELRTLIARFTPAQLRLVAAMRRWLLKRLPTAHEVVYEYRDCFVVSYSPNEHGYEGVLSIRGSAEGVRLYFNRGKELPDPEKLLQGSSQSRWILLESASTVTRPEVACLIDEALARNRVPFARTGRGSVVIRSTSAKSEEPTRTKPPTTTKPRFYSMSFARVYPMYVKKAESKGRTKAEVDEIILWLTGHTAKSLQKAMDAEIDIETFYAEAPRFQPNASLIKGVVCGVRVEEIEDETMRKVRYLDKLIDELAKGKAMEKILRK